MAKLVKTSGAKPGVYSNDSFLIVNATIARLPYLRKGKTSKNWRRKAKGSKIEIVLIVGDEI